MTYNLQLNARKTSETEIVTIPPSIKTKSTRMVIYFNFHFTENYLIKGNVVFMTKRTIVWKSWRIYGQVCTNAEDLCVWVVYGTPHSHDCPFQLYDMWQENCMGLFCIGWKIVQGFTVLKGYLTVQRFLFKCLNSEYKHL